MEKQDWGIYWKGWGVWSLESDMGTRGSGYPRVPAGEPRFWVANVRVNRGSGYD